MLYGAHEPNCVAGGAAGQSVRTISGTALLDDDDAMLDDDGADDADEDEPWSDDELELITALDALELDGTALDEMTLDEMALDVVELDGTELEALELNTTTELLELRTELDDTELDVMMSSRAGYAFLTKSWKASGNQRPATGAFAKAPVPRLVLLPSLKV